MEAMPYLWQSNATESVTTTLPIKEEMGLRIGMPNDHTSTFVLMAGKLFEIEYQSSFRFELIEF